MRFVPIQIEPNISTQKEKVHFFAVRSGVCRDGISIPGRAKSGARTANRFLDVVDDKDIEVHLLFSPRV